MRKSLTLLAVAILLVACGSDDDDASSRIPPPTTVGIGEKVTLKGGHTVQVFGYEAGVVTDAATSFETDQFSVIDVEACGGQGDDVDPSRFRLLMPDDSRVTPSSKVAREPLLQAVSRPGRCSRGLVTFELPATKTPASVSYVATEANVRWRLG